MPQKFARQTQCDFKTRHATYNAASLEASKFRQRGRRSKRPRQGMEVYKCAWCGHFHVGHPRKAINPER